MKTGSPGIDGHLEISRNEERIFIGGDPEGLRSLAGLLCWLADVDQKALPMPDGSRCHVHLHAGEPVDSFNSLTMFSQETEVCRLDAKGTGDFPERYAATADESDSKKYEPLRELELKDVEVPDYVWLDYAVCAYDKEPCGWGGWIIDAAFKVTGKKHPTGTGDKVLPARMHSRCPECGKRLYGTAASIRLDRNARSGP